MYVTRNKTSWKSKQRMKLVFTLRMAWTVWRGYVAVVAMALATAPMTKISAEDICGRRQRLNPLTHSAFTEYNYWAIEVFLQIYKDMAIKT